MNLFNKELIEEKKEGKLYTWHKFCRDPLAIFGLITLTFIVVSVMVGAFMYPVPIDKIDFSQ